MIAAGFVANGADVYIASRKDTSQFAAALTHSHGAANGGTCTALVADLAKEGDVVALAKELGERTKGVLDVLVNNAGTNWAEPIETYPVKAWDKVFALNVRSLFQLTQECLPLLEAGAEAEGGGPARVINIASVEGVMVPFLDTFAYSSSKAAVIHLSKVLAGKLEGRDITVNAVLPGPFPSRMMDVTIERATEAGISAGTVLGRLGTPEDIAGTAL
jgi:NAD(P)-dependent dehydrogenase (short-subunit alcohol dehydrogenase family)